MFCGECGAQNPDTNQFCKNCGKPLGRNQPAARPSPTPSAQPAPPVYVPAPAAVYQPPAQATGVVAPGVQKRQWNWLGIASIPVGILSWGFLPLILASCAILLGVAGLALFKKATGRIGISSIIGILLGLGTLIVFIALG